MLLPPAIDSLSRIRYFQVGRPALRAAMFFARKRNLS